MFYEFELSTSELTITGWLLSKCEILIGHNLSLKYHRNNLYECDQTSRQKYCNIIDFLHLNRTRLTNK